MPGLLSQPPATGAEISRSADVKTFGWLISNKRAGLLHFPFIKVHLWSEKTPDNMRKIILYLSQSTSCFLMSGCKQDGKKCFRRAGSASIGCKHECRNQQNGHSNLPPVTCESLDSRELFWNFTSQSRVIFSVMRRYRTNVSYWVTESVRHSKNRVDWCDPGEWRYLL